MAIRRSIRLPKQWPAHVKSGVLQAISFGQRRSLSYARSRSGAVEMGWLLTLLSPLFRLLGWEIPKREREEDRHERERQRRDQRRREVREVLIQYQVGVYKFG